MTPLSEERRKPMPTLAGWTEAQRQGYVESFRRSAAASGWHVVEERRVHDVFDAKGERNTFVWKLARP